jgi:hypothetical protein
MPDISVADLQGIIEFILDLKCHQEVANSELKRLGGDPISLAAEYKRVSALLGKIPKVAWIRANLQRSAGRDLSELVQVLRSRK